MPDRIKLLPDVVANQIAAGEVVNNPSSVVKEMMENAVDAGALKVTVNFRDGGKELIHVVDDGCGMSPIDARMAFDRHATSKISKAEDIYAISTFGFRGEALASIAAVAEVEVRTRQGSEEYGTSVEIAGGKFRTQSSISCQPGTQFLVKNLFYNIPARRRFIESGQKEARRIKEEFRRVALCNPQVAFTLYENDAPLYNLPAASLRQRIVGAIGKNIASNLLELSAQTSIVRIEGFVGRPAASKQNNSEQYLFVNGRYFRSAYFQKAILAAYEKLIPASTKPSYFLYLQIDPDRIDVNVHPQKTEVRFEDSSAVWQIINAAVRESLGKLGALPMMDFDMDTSIEIPVHKPGASYKSPEIKPNLDFDPFREKASDVASPVRLYIGEEFTDYDSSIGGNHVVYAGSDDMLHLEEEFGSSLIEFIEGDGAVQGSLELNHGMEFSTALPLSNRWCLATLAGELLIVDVRRAWEAILFERYIKTAAAGVAASQKLLFHEEATLTMEECALAREHRAELLGAGFDFTVPDEQTVLINAVPADFAGQECAAIFHGLLAALSEGTGTALELRTEKLAAALARTGAARRGAMDTESLSDMLRALASCAQANYTPSGLPIILRITQQEILRRL